MRRLLLPLFLVRLTLVLLPFLIQVLLALLYPIRSMVITAVIFIYFLVFLLSTQTTVSTTLSPIIPAFNDYQAELATWQSAYQLQPTHRDVLLNLGLIYQAQGDQAQARHYFLQAKKVDPNHERVKIFVE